MRTLHAVLGTGAGPNLISSDVLTICCPPNLVTLSPLPRLHDANGRPLQLLGITVFSFGGATITFESDALS